MSYWKNLKYISKKKKNYLLNFCLIKIQDTFNVQVKYFIYIFRIFLKNKIIILTRSNRVLKIFSIIKTRYEIVPIDLRIFLLKVYEKKDVDYYVNYMNYIKIFYRIHINK